ncbi:MAG: accessory gene regulator B family protein [Roseburia sp.]|nr:accessory gene regulator B family protein [Roseburia sp.]MCM1234224.1 accessory gene regulator B family protein [Ruminococcus flavefaciens]
MELSENLLEYVVETVMNWLWTEQTDIRRFEIIRYGIKCLLCEFVKFLILITVFALTHNTMDFLISCCTLIIMRIYIGGTHRHTWTGCFFQSLFTFAAIILLKQNISFSFPMIYSVYLIMIVWIWKKAPLVSPNRAAYDSFQRMRFKTKAVTVLLILLMLIISLPKEMAGNIIWTIIAVLFDSMIAATKTHNDRG